MVAASKRTRTYFLYLILRDTNATYTSSTSRMLVTSASSLADSAADDFSTSSCSSSFAIEEFVSVVMDGVVLSFGKSLSFNSFFLLFVVVFRIFFDACCCSRVFSRSPQMAFKLKQKYCKGYRRQFNQSVLLDTGDDLGHGNGTKMFNNEKKFYYTNGSRKSLSQHHG